MQAIIKWASALALTLIGLGVVYHFSTQTIDFRSYHIGVTGYFDGTRPMYGPLSGMGWPMHFRYPPLFVFLFWPFTLLSLPVAAGLWTCLKVVTLIFLLRTLLVRLKFSAESWWIPCLLAGPYVIQELRYGNVQFFIFALVAIALIASQTNPIRAGAALGIAASVKVWPLFFFPYLFVRREWRTLGWAASFVIVFTLLPALYLGFGQLMDLLGDWTRQEFATQVGPTEHWYPSQSFRGILMRYLTVIDYTEVPDTEYSRVLASLGAPVIPDSDYVQIHVVDVDPLVVREVWLLLEAIAYLGFLVLTVFHKGSNGWALHGVAFCAILLLQPFTQHYALAVLLWPGLVAAKLVESPETPLGVRMAVYSSAVLAGIQPFVPAQRYMQVIGVDVLVISLLASAMIWATLSIEWDRPCQESFRSHS